MKAKVILDAILAMRDIGQISLYLNPGEFGHACARLDKARYALEIELEKLDIEIERPEKE